jgi:oligoribonuclease
MESAEAIVIEFLQKYNVPYKSAPLAGNSIHTDRRFLYKYMPNLIDYLSYKIIDVTTFKHLCRRWNSKLNQNRPKKKLGHRATDDILESI